MNARVRPGTNMLDGIMGGAGAVPGLLQRARRPNPGNTPLSGDILRAFDTYNTDLAAAAGGLG